MFVFVSFWRLFEEVLFDDDVFGVIWMYVDDYNWVNNEVFVVVCCEEMFVREG